MNNSKMLKYVARYRALVKQESDVDYAWCVFARDLRGEFADNGQGDDLFIKWCETEFGLVGFKAKDLLTRATAATVLPDEKSFKEIGGYKAVQHVILLPKNEQVNVLQAARASNKAVRTVMRERGHVHVQKPPTVAPCSTAYTDAVSLTEYIARTCKDIPRDILTIMTRYARGNVRRPAVARKAAA